MTRPADRPAGTVRDRDRERHFLHLAAAGLDHPTPGTWTGGAIARLDQAGDTIRWRPLDAFLVELAEEALDLGAWAAITRPHPQARPLLPTLLEVARYGAAAHAALTRWEQR